MLLLFFNSYPKVIEAIDIGKTSRCFSKFQSDFNSRHRVGIIYQIVKISSYLQILSRQHLLSNHQ